MARWTCIALACVGAPIGAQSGAIEDQEQFEARVRPVLVASCYECHSAGAKKLKGGLRLDSRAGWEAGGDSGAVIVPGDPEASLLVRAIRYAESDLRMPPKGKLAQREIDDLVEWVRRGAPDPRVEGATEARSTRDAGSSAGSHWAFQPVRDVAPPAVRDERWIANDVDRFVLAGLEAAGLAPAPQADRRTLIRRATFDLIGLPPTPEEVDAFLVDVAPGAWERVVDRLLASPHYGERWGRRWLDLARYADSNGLDENLAIANAWRYRDAVVRALNADMPYDRFVTAQLAGDLLPEPASKDELADQLALTGFLALGPKMLAEQDKQKLVADVVDEQIDVASKAFLGVTLGCARCHDHKFDPFTQRDYTALAGIFHSTSALGNTEFVSRWREVELATRAEKDARDRHVEAVAGVETLIAGVKERGDAQSAQLWRADLAAYLLAGEEAGRGTILLEAEEPSRGNLIADRETWGTPDVVVARTGKPDELQFAEYDVTLPVSGAWQLEVRYASAEARPMKLAIDGAERVAACLGAHTGSFHPDGQAWERVGTFALRAGRNVLRLERAGAVPHLDALLLVPAEAPGVAVDWPRATEPAAGLVLEVVRNFAVFLERKQRAGDPVFRVWSELAQIPDEEFPAAAGARVEHLRAEREAGRIALSPLTAKTLDGLPPQSLRELAGRYQTTFALVEESWAKARAAATNKTLDKLPDADEEALRVVLHGSGGPFALTRALRERYYPAEVRSELDGRGAELDALKKRAPAAFETVPGAAEGKAEDLQVFVRGNHLNGQGPPVARGVPEVLAQTCPPPAIGAQESGRLQLARWLVDVRNPLAARVIANRVWQGHFGAGLVRTPSNFGLRGEAPSHPELLDWLARRLVLDGWSLKALHRLVMTSSAYRTSARCDAEAAQRDPDNRLLARANRRRLEAEAVRDALLAVAGTLDRTLGGSLLATKNGDYVTNDQSADAARYQSARRSLYLPVIRNALYDLFGTFDYGDPSLPNEARSSTTDPAQALALLNSPLALEQSLAFARSLLARSDLDDAARLEHAWVRALARPPEREEVGRASTFLADMAARLGGEPAAAREGAWQALCQALLASNEFLHVD